MIDQMTVFTSEVTRVSREVGTEGKLGTAQVKASPACGRPQDNVNFMANTSPPRCAYLGVTFAGRQTATFAQDHGRRAR